MRKYSILLLVACMIFAFCACQAADYKTAIVGDWQMMEGNKENPDGKVFVFTESGLMYEKGYAGIMQSEYTIDGNKLTVSFENPTNGNMTTRVDKITISGDIFTLYSDDGSAPQKFKRVG